jgi:hypothetical protein
MILTGLVDALAEVFFSGIDWPQALHLAVLTPGGSVASLMVYFFWQFGQVIFIIERPTSNNVFC